MATDQQAIIDAFYWRHGKCCAGCDWWRSYVSGAGECTKSAPVSARERGAVLGLHNYSMDIGAGHPFTPRSHVCGDFRDDFDWLSLPVAYLAQIGAPINELRAASNPAHPLSRITHDH